MTERYVVLPVEPTYKMITGGHQGFDLCSCSVRRKIIEDAIANAPQPDVVVVERDQLKRLIRLLNSKSAFGKAEAKNEIKQLLEGAG